MATYKKLLKNRAGDTIIPVTDVISDYSDAEVNTGCTWRDGRQIYKKTIKINSLPNNASGLYPHNITNLKFVTKIEGIMADSTDTTFWSLPYEHASIIDVNSTNIQIITDYNLSAYYAYITLYYTKTS